MPVSTRRRPRQQIHEEDCADAKPDESLLVLAVGPAGEAGVDSGQEGFQRGVQ